MDLNQKKRVISVDLTTESLGRKSNSGMFGQDYGTCGRRSGMCGRYSGIQYLYQKGGGAAPFIFRKNLASNEHKWPKFWEVNFTYAI